MPSAHITDFIRNRIEQDLASSTHPNHIVTRFPPEPNGYLHIGHAKSICLNFSLAQQYPNSQCHLRMDDTNPLNEKTEYIKAIQNDIRWLGFDWQQHLYFASDYYETLYTIATQLIHDGKAFVCSLSADQMRESRGTLKTPGQASPDRERSIEENLALFQAMREGKHPEGSLTLRAKIDMAASNINLRDPVLYRIRHFHHPRTHDTWCIYPMYDYAHALSDAIEDITHSLCTLEFQDHRPLYDWFVKHSGLETKPQQIEFSRLNLNYTITSKRKLKQLVEEKHVTGWDDPRMPTLAGLRRRGYPPQAIVSFCDHIGISKQDSVIDVSILEDHARNALNECAPRRLAVVDPLKVIISNYPEDQEEMISMANHPQNPEFGRRDVPFSREIVIERDDFSENPPPKYKRLSPDKEVRLLSAYAIRVVNIIKDEDGNITALECHYDPDTLGGQKPKDGRKIKGAIHWLSSKHAKDVELRHYDRLFHNANPNTTETLAQAINPDSLRIIQQAKIEPTLTMATPGDSFQFNRLAYYCADLNDHEPKHPVFNRVVGLRDSWKKT
jgi:glutaminyl-tRNA synthetase